MRNKLAASISAVTSATAAPFELLIHSADGNRLGGLFETGDGTLQFEGDAQGSAWQFFDLVVQQNSHALSSADQRIKTMIRKLEDAMPNEQEDLVLNAAASTFPKVPAVTYESLARMAADLRAFQDSKRNREIRELADHMWSLGWRDPSGGRDGFVSALGALLTAWEDRSRQANPFDTVRIPMPAMPRGNAL